MKTPITISFLALAISLSSACSTADNDSDPMNAPAGGSAANTTTAGTAGPTGTGSAVTMAGGTSATGGMTSTTGGMTSTTGGMTSATGGMTSATGGTTSATGGTTSATGGTTSATGDTTSATGGTASTTGGTTSATGGTTNGPDGLLPQDGNPNQDELDFADQFISDDLAADTLVADKMVAWQMDERLLYWPEAHGGWMKTTLTTRYLDEPVPSDGALEVEHVRNRGLGCIDNEASTTEIVVLADVYKRSGETKYRDSARKGLEFLITMVEPSGGVGQYYPDRSPTEQHYSDHATFNDGAMVRVMTVLQRAVRHYAPFDSDIFAEDQLARAAEAVARGIDFILKSQIIDGAQRTVWCAQHGMEDYAPKQGRSYEHPSKSGSESVGIVAFLMAQEQTPEIREAIQGALAWFRDSSTHLPDTHYVRPASPTDPNPFQPNPGTRCWYRFSDLKGNLPIFSDRDGNIYRDIEELRQPDDGNRFVGYNWGGSWAEPLLSYAESVGY